MDLMDLLDNWKKIAGMNSPMLPGQPTQATPPFVPKPGQSGYQPASASTPFGTKIPQPGEQGYQPSTPGTPFGTKSPLQPIQTPNRAGRLPEVTVPEREKVGIDSILKEVETPERDKKYAKNDIWQMQNMDRPWYKDGAFMTELGGRLGNAFGGLTTRGNSHAETMMNAQKIKDAQAMRSSNKSMNYLIENNPEMAEKLLALPPEQRGKFMQLALAQNAGLTTGDESAFSEKVRMYKAANPNATDAEALDWAKGGSGTNVTVNNGGGSFADALGTQAAEWYKKKSGAYSNINDMQRVVSTIEAAIEKGDQLTGGIINYMPDDVQDLFAPQSQDVRRSVEKVIQSSLKETLGAQFTEKEGENVIKRTWNPQAPIEYNLRRTKQLLAELQSYAVGQDQLLEGMLSSNGDIMEHMRNNPGSGGATAESIRYLQYDDALDAGINPEPSPAGSSGPPAGIDPDIWEEMTDEQRALFQ